MPRKYESDLKGRARRLRSDMTDAERALWHYLRRDNIHGVRFYRQRPLASFIVDFYAPAAALVVEIDGGQHFDPGEIEYDRKRTRYLESLGLTVLRFDNHQVLRATETVVERIHGEVVKRVEKSGNPSLPPFEKGSRKVGR